MIQTRIESADVIGTGRVYEIAPNAYRNAATGEIIVTDNKSAIVIKVVPTED